jgi:hypothetical protein
MSINLMLLRLNKQYSVQKEHVKVLGLFGNYDDKKGDLLKNLIWLVGDNPTTFRIETLIPINSEIVGFFIGNINSDHTMS